MQTRVFAKHGGVSVSGVSLRRLLDTGDTSGLAAIQSLFHRHGWLHLPDQADMTPAHQVAFAALFPHDPRVLSETMNSPFSLVTLPEHPLVMAQGNVALDNHYGLTTQLQASALAVESGLEWHTDNIDSHVQSVLTCLHCTRAPDSGGETLFVSGSHLFAALSPAQQQTASELTVRYCRWTEDYSEQTGDVLVQHMMNPEGTRLAAAAPPPTPDEPITSSHALVKPHGESGVPTLITSPSIVHSVELPSGEVLGTEESRDVVEELLTPGVARGPDQSWESYYAEGTPSGVVSHTWAADDFVAWDNRQMLHSTTTPLRWKGDRLMHRVRLPMAQP